MYEHLEIYKMGKNYKYFCVSPYFAQLINKALNYPYPKETNFIKERSEAIFTFTDSQLPAILKIVQK